MRILALLGLAALLAPSALAVDLLPTEVRFGETEARILVRGAEGSVALRTEPTILAAAAPPGGEPGEFVPTPRVLEANHTWRGIDRMVELVLRRDDARMPIDVMIQDASNAGVWLEWPGAARSISAGQWVAPIALALAFWRKQLAP